MKQLEMSDTVDDDDDVLKESDCLTPSCSPSTETQSGKKYQTKYYECQYCDYSTTRKFNLLRHVATSKDHGTIDELHATLALYPTSVIYGRQLGT